MRSEFQILLAATLVCFLLILWAGRYSKWFALFNGALFLLYSIYMYHGLFFDDSEENKGTALAWWFYLLVITGMQIVIVGTYTLCKAVKRTST